MGRIWASEGKEKKKWKGKRMGKGDVRPQDGVWCRGRFIVKKWERTNKRKANISACKLELGQSTEGGKFWSSWAWTTGKEATRRRKEHMVSKGRIQDQP